MKQVVLLQTENGEPLITNEAGANEILRLRRLLEASESLRSATISTMRRNEAELAEARRLLDDAREPKPVGETCFDAQGIRWYNTSDRERLPFGTKLYAAAPVPAQSAADVAAIAKAVRDIPSRLESLGGQRFAYVKLSEVIDTIYSVAGKQPAVPEAVAKGAADKLALAYGYLWHVNNSTPGYDAPSDYTRPQLTPKDAAYKARGLLRDMLTNDQRGDGINRAAILSATDSEVKNG